MEKLKSLLDDLASDIRAVDQMEGKTSPPTKRRQFPPAKESDLAAAEKRLGFALPPSYVAFLRIHNGWEGINAGDIAVIGVSGDGYTPTKKEWDGYTKMIEKEYRSEGKDYPAQLRSRELTDPGVIYLPHHVPIALNYNGTYWVIDRNRPTKGGEYEIARVELGDKVRKRYLSFAEFLEDQARRVSSELPASKRAKTKARSSSNQQGGAPAKKTASRKAAKAVRKK
jgi:cell wall assembly regulator SMI1